MANVAAAFLVPISLLMGSCMIKGGVEQYQEEVRSVKSSINSNYSSLLIQEEISVDIKTPLGEQVKNLFTEAFAKDKLVGKFTYALPYTVLCELPNLCARALVKSAVCATKQHLMSEVQQ